MAGVTTDSSPSEKRQRLLEVLSIVVISILLGLVSRLETRLYELSSSLARDDSFVASIVFYSIININVLLVIILSFLVVRNIIKLLVERRRGIFGSQLRTKLVTTLMIFSLVPTVIIFYVSTRFINESFDEWFGSKVRQSMQEARDASAQIYLQDQRRLEGIARVASLKLRISPAPPLTHSSPTIEVPLDGFELEYGVYSVKVYDRNSNKVWSSIREPISQESENKERQLIGSILGRFSSRPGLTSTSLVESESNRDVVRAAVPLRKKSDHELSGLILVEERFDVPFLRSLEQIMEGFSRLKPGAQLVRVSYLILITVMTLLIVFAAVWFGFRVARTIIGPIQILAEATKEIALGNYSITLTPQFDDETGQLIRSFNTMTGDLEKHRNTALEAKLKLELSHAEIERRQRYMEIVFSNIAAGVIAVDSGEHVTAFNQTAASMLKLSFTEPLVGRPIKDVLGDVLWSIFWDDIISTARTNRLNSTREIDLRPAGIEIALFVATTVVYNDDSQELGYVVVFDDATQRVKQEKILAWREVASRIAHEIKNPITPIKLSAERLLRRFSSRFDGDDKTVFESCVRSILVQVESLKNLVNEFGQFARLPSINLQAADLGEVVILALEVFKQGYSNIDFLAKVSPDLPKATIDVEQMNRALVNLIANAVDAVTELESPKKGQVTCKVSFNSKQNKFMISIEDNGHGIPASLRDKVFDPYVSSKTTGTGLGLAITNQIIAEHGGTVKVADTSHMGTRITVEIPGQKSAAPDGTKS
jgi:two-component system nitrogen regulation sensor histidine kinase NtrY